jgi:hypothetical protein
LKVRISSAQVLAIVAIVLALGGNALAFQLGKNSVGSKQLKKNSVTTAKVKKEAISAAKIKKGSLTGAQINAATLGTVPTAQSALSAQTAQTVAPSEAWHEIGAPGEPTFEQNWGNLESFSENAAFYKDAMGIVHLRGLVSGGTGELIFRLPPGYRPAPEKEIRFAVYCASGVCASGTGRAEIYGPGFDDLGLSAGVVVPGTTASLNGIDFRAES